jgi:hypothetical protein
MTDLIIPSRYCGPPSSGNGGYSAGAVSAYADAECPDPSTGSGRRDRARPWPTVEVVIGEEHVLVGRGQDARKAWNSSTMYDADGRVVGTADHLWVAVDPEAFS